MDVDVDVVVDVKVDIDKYNIVQAPQKRFQRLWCLSLDAGTIDLNMGNVVYTSTFYCVETYSVHDWSL
jgi:hypothetical protein